eukprot:TRINITY_DN14536_c0_g1_i1.p1 TRINITY_DN14536_c0_g1~~TRINITY_DN14536_c0_g1_i1.p1  ORF type:complete len:273 (+),score=57.76 TRINITY_DN14536_c0_g1_i1:52-870(+)
MIPLVNIVTITVISVLQLQCGLLDISPLLTKSVHFGGIQLIKETGPIDMRCEPSLYWESMWLIESCEDLKAINTKGVGSDIELLLETCRKSTRRIKRQFYGCHGVKAAQFEVMNLASSDSFQRQQHLFCSFVADCGIDDFITSCREGLPLISRLVDVCSDIDQLTTRCYSATPSTTISPTTVKALTAAINGAQEIVPHLRPFIKVPSGLVTGSGSNNDKKDQRKNNRKQLRKLKNSWKSDTKDDHQPDDVVSMETVLGNNTLRDNNNDTIVL